MRTIVHGWWTKAMKDERFILMNALVAPQAVLNVLQAKRLLATGEAKNVSDAIKMSNISRSVFYKYKDNVFDYGGRNNGRIITLLATLRDEQGVLSKVIGELSKSGANILTLNQNTPIRGTALVSISVRTENINVDEDAMIKSVEELDGVKSIVLIDNEI